MRARHSCPRQQVLAIESPGSTDRARTYTIVCVTSPTTVEAGVGDKHGLEANPFRTRSRYTHKYLSINYACGGVPTVNTMVCSQQPYFRTSVLGHTERMSHRQPPHTAVMTVSQGKQTTNHIHTFKHNAYKLYKLKAGMEKLGLEVPTSRPSESTRNTAIFTPELFFTSTETV